MVFLLVVVAGVGDYGRFARAPQNGVTTNAMLTAR